MAEQADSPTDVERRFQFTIGGMMLVVFGFAIGLAVMRIMTNEFIGRYSGWDSGLFATATFWIILGLFHQVRDMWRTYRGRTDLSNDERWGWRVAVFWRIALAGILLGYHVIELLQRQKFISLPEDEQALTFVGLFSRAALFYFSVVIVLASVPRMARKPRAHSIGSWLINIMALFAAIVWCMYIWCYETFVNFLTYTMTVAIEIGRSPPYVPVGVDPNVAARASHFFWCSLLPGVLVFVNLGLTYLLAQQWTAGRRRRLIWAGLLALGLSAPIWYLVWLYTGGLYRFSPEMGVSLSMGPLNCWFFALLLMVVFVTAATHRMIPKADDQPRTTQLNWRRNPRAYFHERCGIMILLAIVSIGYIFESMIYLVTTPWLSLTDVIDVLLTDSSSFLFLLWAIFLLALKGIYTGWSRWGEVPTAQPRLQPDRFCAVWLAMFATSISGAGTLVWFSFSLWFTPWYY